MKAKEGLGLLVYDNRIIFYAVSTNPLNNHFTMKK